PSRSESSRKSRILTSSSEPQPTRDLVREQQPLIGQADTLVVHDHPPRRHTRQRGFAVFERIAAVTGEMASAIDPVHRAQAEPHRLVLEIRGTAVLDVAGGRAAE